MSLFFKPRTDLKGSFCRRNIILPYFYPHGAYLLTRRNLEEVAAPARPETRRARIRTSNTPKHFTFF